MDFTLKKYKELLESLIANQYKFQTFDEFLKHPEELAIVLRHDVDLLPDHSLQFAIIQNELGVKGTYYFRAVPESWDEKVIKEIASMDHEIGYHYENLTTCKGDFSKGINDFETNLNELRKLAPVSTICMHGSPMSRYDSKDLWKKYDYKSFDIIGEPYFDIDFDKVLYLTDTGRRWDGDKVSVRDRVNSSFDISVHSTEDIIALSNKNQLPDKIMFTFHPQRWTDNRYIWAKEYILQNIKNVIKKYIFVKSNK